MSLPPTPCLRAVLIWGISLAPSPLWSHGVQVELSVSNGQLTTDATTYTAAFAAPIPGAPAIPALTELPGLGVASGLLPGTALELEVADQLWFSTGQAGGSVADTAATLTIFDPNFQINAEYVVTQQTQQLTGMFWDTYPGGPNWEAHGTYTLDPSTDPAGAYGLVLRVNAPPYAVSDPFLIVFSTHDLAPARFLDAFNQIEAAALQSSVPGDYTGEGALSAVDIDLLSAEVRQGTHDPAFDLNGDNLVTDADRTTWVEELFGTLFGDANLDFLVNASGDGATLLSNLGSPGPSGWAEGDFNGDATVTASGDGSVLLNALSGDLAESGPRAVPEPTSWMLLAFAIGILLQRTHRAREHTGAGTQWRGNTVAWEHSGVGTQWRGNTVAREHSGVGTQWRGNTVAWEHSGAGTQWRGNTVAREHSGAGTQWRGVRNLFASQGSPASPPGIKGF